MILILTMAGKYQRFADAGYKTPKYLLPWGDRVLLWTILSELKKGDKFSQVFLVGNVRDEHFMPHVRAIMQDQGIPRHNLSLIHDTTGQAETAAIGLDKMAEHAKDWKGPVVFHNVDTILLARDYGEVKRSLESKADGFIDIFGSNNRNYSYVLTDEKGRVREIAEKVVVSDMATSGFYGFKNADTFRKHFAADDTYISGVYKKMIEAGANVITGQKHKESETIVLGTPAEYTNASLLAFT